MVALLVVVMVVHGIRPQGDGVCGCTCFGGCFFFVSVSVSV